MTQYLAKVSIALKPTVNDPEGNTIAGALESLGFAEVSKVRSGKFFQVTLEAADQSTAETAVREMCVRLLDNPVIETFSFDIAAVS